MDSELWEVEGVDLGSHYLSTRMISTGLRIEVVHKESAQVMKGTWTGLHGVDREHFLTELRKAKVIDDDGPAFLRVGFSRLSLDAVEESALDARFRALELQMMRLNTTLYARVSFLELFIYSSHGQFGSNDFSVSLTMHLRNCICVAVNQIKESGKTRGIVSLRKMFEAGNFPTVLVDDPAYSVDQVWSLHFIKNTIRYNDGISTTPIDKDRFELVIEDDEKLPVQYVPGTDSNGKKSELVLRINRKLFPNGPERSRGGSCGVSSRGGRCGVIRCNDVPQPGVIYILGDHDFLA